MCRSARFGRSAWPARDPAKAAVLAEELSSVLETGVQSVSTYAEALDGADIATATAHSLEPVIRRPWGAGVHITSVGYNPAGHEVDDATVAQALVCVDA